MTLLNKEEQIQLSEMIVDVVDLMVRANHVELPEVSSPGYASMRYFNNARAAWGRSGMPDVESELYFNEVQVRDVAHQFDVCSFAPCNYESGYLEQIASDAPDKEYLLKIDKALDSRHRYQFQRYRRLSWKEVRGKMPLTSDGKIIERALGVITEDAKWFGKRWYYQQRGQSWWEYYAPMPPAGMEAPPHMGNNYWTQADERESTSIAGALSMAFTEYYLWVVRIGTPRNKVSFAIDPRASKHVFTLRDIPEGKSRRESLRNWIAGHWRNLPSDDESQSYVIQHLRGQTKFSWLGLECELVPSADAIQTYKRLQETTPSPRPRREKPRRQIKTA